MLNDNKIFRMIKNNVMQIKLKRGCVNFMLAKVKNCKIYGP